MGARGPIVETQTRRGTPPDLDLAGLSDEELDGLGLDPAEVADVYPLSPMQQGMLFHALKDGGSGVYVNQVGVEIRGLDASRLRSAWQAVSDRHAVLRTALRLARAVGPALQVVYREADGAVRRGGLARASIAA